MESWLLTFLLVHGVGHDERTWFPLFSVCYFHHDKDGAVACLHNQAHTMDGIAVGRSPTYNALLVYNPRSKQYYEPDSYRFDSYRLPSSVYPSLKYDGGLFCSLYWDNNPSMKELYPPGTRVERLDPSTNMLLAGTVMDIPLHSNPNGSAMYLNSLLSFRLGVELPMSMSGNTIRASLRTTPVAHTISVSKRMLRKSLKTGVWTFPICLSLGLTYAQRVFCSQAMLLIHSFVHRQTIIALLLWHHLLSPLTPWQTL
jgi:hypothetical protein